MIRIILVFCCLLLVQEDPVISWSASYKLTWSDFKGEPYPSVSAAAITASGLTFGYSIRQTDHEVVGFSADVHAHFYPEKSWYKPEKANAHILGHEQLHFDVTELYARKFRYRVSKLKLSNNIKAELKALQKSINMELKALQTKYDEETDHSRNFEAQTKWDAYIAAELEKFATYKSK